jgi:hypothetical protein
VSSHFSHHSWNVSKPGIWWHLMTLEAVEGIWWDLMTSSTFLGAASGAGVEVSQLLSSIRVAQSQCPRAPGHLGGIPPNQSKVICPNSKHHQHQTSSTSSTS